MRRPVLLAVLVAVVAFGVLLTANSKRGGSDVPSAADAPAGAASADRRASRPSARVLARRRAAPRPVRAARCPSGLASCRSVRGRVLYVESVDPDGDGDLHVVLAGGRVTGPGLTAVDVAPALRPRRDPRVGDLLSAAGQVQRGSFGQSQIHAAELHVSARAR